jgi:hypothetical protein
MTRSSIGTPKAAELATRIGFALRSAATVCSRAARHLNRDVIRELAAAHILSDTAGGARAGVLR